MEILLYVVVFVAVAFWLVRKFPNSKISEQVNNIVNQQSVAANVAADVVPNVVAAKSLVTEVALEQSASIQAVVEPAKDVKVAPTVSVATIEVNIPEDSVLKRHYLATLAAERNALANPYPTDSVLRRHHEHLHALFVTPTADAIRFQASVVKPVVEQSDFIPEDSVLRRHFLSELASSEANLN